jgi:hypothetical protein
MRCSIGFRTILASQAGGVPLGFTMLLGLKHGHACDSIACLLDGGRFLTGVTMHSVTALMTSQH